MASLSDDELYDAIQRKRQRDPVFRRNLDNAVANKDERSVRQLIMMIIGEVTTAVVRAIINWFTQGF
jgi:hypothetical protein